MNYLESLYQAYVTSPEYEQLCASGNTERTEQLNAVLKDIPDRRTRIAISDLTAEETYYFEKQAFIMGFKYALSNGGVIS